MHVILHAMDELYMLLLMQWREGVERASATDSTPRSYDSYCHHTPLTIRKVCCNRCTSCLLWTNQFWVYQTDAPMSSLIILIS